MSRDKTKGSKPFQERRGPEHLENKLQQELVGELVLGADLLVHLGNTVTTS